MYSWKALAARSCRASTFGSAYFFFRCSARVRGSPGHQLLVTSWSSHCARIGTAAFIARTFRSVRLYLWRPRNSASVSAGFDTSSVTRLRQRLPSGSFTSDWIGPSA